MTALREIRILQLLNHENVINLVEVCRSKGESAPVPVCLTQPLRWRQGM